MDYGQLLFGNCIVATTRFTNFRYEYITLWKMKNKWKGCVYPVKNKIKECIADNIDIYVIEMNNDENKIIGVGKINNIIKKRKKVYDGNELERNNQYLYKSKYFISREDILKKEENKELIKYLETLLFTGYNHVKQLKGITCLHPDRIAYDTPIKKRVITCSICGLKKKGHKCPGKRIADKRDNTKCELCGKRRKGHICKALPKNNERLKKITLFFNSLFVK